MDCSRPKTHDPELWLDFAPERSRELVERVRGWILCWEPDLVECIKWNMLCFRGRKLVCGLSACKRHLGITFFRGTELRDLTQLFQRGEGNTNILSFQVRTLAELDAKALQRLLHAAVALDADDSAQRPPAKKREQWPMPEVLAKALKKNKAAAAGYAQLSASCQREYLVWVSTAKMAETIQRRLDETLRALATGRKWAQRKE
jgi:uncharacterized protein YdeI (YjbR/CyaY-like superfamily)